MKRRTQRRGGVIIPALAACFCIGIMVGWWLRSGAPMPAVSQIGNRDTASQTPAGRVLDPAANAATDPAGSTAGPKGPTLQAADAGTAGRVVATTGEPLVAPAPPTSLPAAGAITDLRGHGLRLPIDDANIEAMKGGFEEGRDAGGRPHEAVDMLAPRNTPVRAVEDGAIAKLFTSKAGGTTIYQFDPTEQYCYYYAHLERYAEGLREGDAVRKGEVIGYVGTTGNAPKNTPHLHFAVFKLTAAKHWWEGTPIDPFDILR
jgi:murein DD-endopeptidase MepM/ murein hydrolase activator NlpD